MITFHSKIESLSLLFIVELEKMNSFFYFVFEVINWFRLVPFGIELILYLLYIWGSTTKINGFTNSQLLYTKLDFLQSVPGFEDKLAINI